MSIVPFLFGCSQYNPSGASDSDTGKKRGGRAPAAGRGRPPARRAAAKRKMSETEDEEDTPISSDEDSDVSLRFCLLARELCYANLL